MNGKIVASAFVAVILGVIAWLSIDFPLSLAIATWSFMVAFAFLAALVIWLVRWS